MNTIKKIINSPEDVVEEYMQGFASAHSDMVKVFYDPNYIIRRDAPVKGKVGVVSGGGSGHEPMHNGYVGKGMLDAACPGAVFTSPAPDQIYKASKAVDSGAGVLHIVKNYTGDVMNFDMASDLLEADGIKSKSVVINDDVAIEDSFYTAGRRGVGATVIAEKIVGGAAEDGVGLEELEKMCAQINKDSKSMGVALTSCTIPHVGEPSFDLADDEYELGIGIHGESGRKRLKMESADKIAERLMQPILDELSLNRDDEILMLVNGMGGTPEMELYILYRKAKEIAENAGLQISRNLVGTYMTSLEMQGASITITKLDETLKKYWDAPVNTPAFRRGV